MAIDAARSAPRREPMSPVDIAWLRMDEPNNLMQINGVLVFDGKVDFERVRRLIGERLQRIRRFRQRVVTLNGSYFWEEDPEFDLSRHVVPTRLPEPGDEAAAQRAFGDIMAEPLDHRHPLWQFQVIEEYRGGTAVYGRFHHCVGDGVALMLVLLSLCDTEPGGPPAATATDEVPTPLPGPFADLFSHPIDSLAAFKRLAEEVMPDTMRLLTLPVDALKKSSRLLRGAASLTALGRLIAYSADPPTAFKGPLKTEKRATWSGQIAVEEVKQVGRALGGTVNDVLLTAMAGGLRRYLARQAEPDPELVMRAAMPVNLRPIEKMSELGNRFGLAFLGLPVGIADPVARLAELRRRADRLKRSAEPLVAYGILHAMGLSPLPIQRLVVRIFGAKATAVMTNVPGPRKTLYFAGRPLEDFFFWVPQSGRLGLGISILSYRGQARLGVASDAGLVPDPERLVSGFHEEYDLLRERASAGR